MSSTNVGNQTIMWRYRTPLIGGDLAKMNATVLYPGVYEGLVPSRLSDTRVEFQPGTMLIRDYDPDTLEIGDRLVKVLFESSFSIAVENPAQFIVARMIWVDSETNYVDILNVDTVEDYDVLLAAVSYTFTGSSYIIASVDTEAVSKGINFYIEKLALNLKPAPDYSADRTVEIAEGRFIVSNQAVYFAGGSTQLDASTHIDGRYDIVGIDETGTIVVTKGEEGGEVPAFGAFLPVVQVHVRPSITNFLASDLLDIRPFMSMMIYTGDIDSSEVYQATTGFTVIPTDKDNLNLIVNWLDSYFAAGTEAATLEGHSADYFLDVSSGAQSVDVSKPVVTNLDADKLDGLDASYWTGRGFGSAAVLLSSLTIDDLDDLTTQGFYYELGATVLANKPSALSSNFIYVSVIRAEEIPAQLLQICYDGESGANAYLRVYTGSWSDWIPLRLSAASEITNDSIAEGTYVSDALTSLQNSVFRNLDAMDIEDMNDLTTPGMYGGDWYLTHVKVPTLSNFPYFSAGDAFLIWVSGGDCSVPSQSEPVYHLYRQVVLGVRFTGEIFTMYERTGGDFTGSLVWTDWVRVYEQPRLIATINGLTVHLNDYDYVICDSSEAPASATVFNSIAAFMSDGSMTDKKVLLRKNSGGWAEDLKILFSSGNNFDRMQFDFEDGAYLIGNLVIDGAGQERLDLSGNIYSYDGTDTFTLESGSQTAFTEDYIWLNYRAYKVSSTTTSTIVLDTTQTPYYGSYTNIVISAALNSFMPGLKFRNVHIDGTGDSSVSGVRIMFAEVEMSGLVENTSITSSMSDLTYAYANMSNDSYWRESNGAYYSRLTGSLSFRNVVLNSFGPGTLSSVLRGVVSDVTIGSVEDSKDAGNSTGALYLNSSSCTFSSLINIRGNRAVYSTASKIKGSLIKENIHSSAGSLYAISDSHAEIDQITECHNLSYAAGVALEGGSTFVGSLISNCRSENSGDGYSGAGISLNDSTAHVGVIRGCYIYASGATSCFGSAVSLQDTNSYAYIGTIRDCICDTYTNYAVVTAGRLEVGEIIDCTETDDWSVTGTGTLRIGRIINSGSQSTTDETVYPSPTSDDIANASTVTGVTVTDALNTLAGSSGGSGDSYNVVSASQTLTAGNKYVVEELTGKINPQFILPSSPTEGQTLEIDAATSIRLHQSIATEIIYWKNKYATTYGANGYLQLLPGDHLKLVYRGAQDVVPVDPYVKLSNPATLPGSVAASYSAARFNSDNRLLAVVNSDTPYLTIYRRDGDTFTALSGFTPTASGCFDADFSPDGQYLVVGYSGGSYLDVYKIAWDEDGDVTFTRCTLTDPMGFSATPNGFSWTSDSRAFVTVAGSTIACFFVSGTTVTRFTSSNATPFYVPATNSVAYSNHLSPDNSWLGVGSSAVQPISKTNPSLMILRASIFAGNAIYGDTYNSCAFEMMPTVDFPPEGYVRGLRFSPCGNYLAVVCDNNAATPVTTGTMQIHFKNEKGWEWPYIYAWSGNITSSYPGTPMIYEGRGWFYYTFSSLTSTSYLINNGVPGGIYEEKTSDITSSAQNTYVHLLSGLNTPYTPSTTTSSPIANFGWHSLLIYKLDRGATRNPWKFMGSYPLFNPYEQPAQNSNAFGQAVAWSKDSEFLAVGHGKAGDSSDARFVSMYRRRGDRFYRLQNPATLPGGPVIGLDYSPDRAYLACGHQYTPWLTLYKTVSSAADSWEVVDFSSVQGTLLTSAGAEQVLMGRFK